MKGSCSDVTSDSGLKLPTNFPLLLLLLSLPPWPQTRENTESGRGGPRVR